MQKKVSKKTKKVEEPQIVDEAKMREENLRNLLLQKRREILKEAMEEIKRFQSDENKQLVETVLDDGDLSVVDLSEDISLKQLSSHRENLLKIDTALQKLKEGSYGICEDCGEEISEKRLEVMPFAIYCRDCQEKKELMSKLEQIVEQ